MRKSYSIILIIILSTFSFSTHSLAVDPTLTIFDKHGNPYWNPDNSTLFLALPGDTFGLELIHAKEEAFGIFMSLYKTPYPLDLVPPPLLLMPPLFPLEVGGVLDVNGVFNSMYMLPASMASLGYDLDIYLQAYVKDDNDNFYLSNGITMRVESTKFRARLRYSWGPAIDLHTEIGNRDDTDVTDNHIPANGPGLQNGGKFFPTHLLDGSGVFVFKDKVEPEGGLPVPTTSIFLNDRDALIPGDSGFDSRFSFYPPLGSSPYIYARDRICRNNENQFNQHIIVPIFDENQEKTHDLNIYHYKYKTLEYVKVQEDPVVWEWQDRFDYGFIALDVLTGEFYELTGTHFKGWADKSAWKPYVTISPDGKFMAAVRHETPEDFEKEGDPPRPDKLYIIRLKKDDLWDSGEHTVFAQMNEGIGTNHDMWWIYPESMVFTGQPDPHLLLVITNRVDNSTQPSAEPPPTIPASLWRVRCGMQNNQAKYYNLNNSGVYLAGGNKYNFTFFGEAVNRPDRVTTQLKMIKSKDHSMVCVRAAGRHYGGTPAQPEFGEYSFDILALNDITYSDADPTSSSFDVVNVTRFDEYDGFQSGFYVKPFGQGRCGFSKAALSEPTIGGYRHIAFCTRSYTSSNQPASPNSVNASDDFYFAPTNGTMAGALIPLTNPNLFAGEFQSFPMPGMGIQDPFFADPNSLLFFCGMNAEVTNNNYDPPRSDLFLYNIVSGSYRNLTDSGYDTGNDVHVSKIEPPYSFFGTVRPCGIFSSKDKRFIFFLRARQKLDADYQLLNMVGIDTADDFALFDLSGNEFSQGIWPEMDVEKVQFNVDHYWGAEALSMIIMPGEYTDRLFFTCKYRTSYNQSAYQLFSLNLDSPANVIPMTFFKYGSSDKQPGMIDNIVSDPLGLYLGFSRANTVNMDWTEGGYEDIFVIDVAGGFHTRNLTSESLQEPLCETASVDGSLRFIHSESEIIPTQFIYGCGPGGADHLANNPPRARLWLYPVGADLNHELPSYPLTEESSILLFDAAPWE